MRYLIGALTGILVTMVLIMVPVFGVRHDLNSLWRNWQEMGLYISTLIAGAGAGLLLSFPREVNSFVVVGNSDVPDQLVERDLLPKRSFRSLFRIRVNRDRTKAIACFLYLVLYVNCAALCQHLGLGIIVSDFTTTQVVRNLGLCLVIVGLYKMLRGLGTRARTSRDGNDDERDADLPLKELSSAEADSEAAVESGSLPVEKPVAEGQGGQATVSVTDPEIDPVDHSLSDLSDHMEQPPDSESPERGSKIGDITRSARDRQSLLVSHVPPSRISFLSAHPVCTGWLIALTGLPLIFMAWFPILAIPGIFVSMGWLFGKEGNKSY